ncbi:MAG: radical SAM protein [Bacteroidales bacterium]|nr:radical SAM protein [Bacteroidales bacterium]
MSVNRLRIGRDGSGVTTLVAFYGCPLHCRYCLNPRCHREGKLNHTVTPEALIETLKIDDLYFRATGGGVCFGGGEPALQVDFIKKFRRLGPKHWRITLETSLNVPTDNILRLFPIVNEWIVDVKDMRLEVYRSYTHADITPVLANLQVLAQQPERCLIRVPIIPDYNTAEDAKESVSRLQTLGFSRFDVFTYTTNRKIISQ